MVNKMVFLKKNLCKDDSWIVCGKLEERGALLLPESKFFSAVTENPALKEIKKLSNHRYRTMKKISGAHL
jgi:hypothetical protein